MSDALQRFGNRTRSRQFAIGMREGLSGAAAPSGLSTALGNFAVPELGIQRGAGHALGRKLRALDPAEREQVLRGAQQVVLDNPRSLVGTGGEANPLVSPALAGISLALGDRPLYQKSKYLPTFQSAYHRVLHGKQGVAGKVREGPLQEPTRGGLVSKTLPHWGTLAAAPLLATAGAPGLAWHGTVGALKSIGAATPGGHAISMDNLRRGVRRGVLPGLSHGDNPYRRDVLEAILSPSLYDTERAIQPVVMAARDRLLQNGAQQFRNTLRETADKLTLRTKRPSVLEETAPGILAGTGLGAAGALALSPRDRRERKS